MAELTVDLTYGSALYEAAEDVGKRDEIAKNADWVLEVLRDNPDPSEFYQLSGDIGERKERNDREDIRRECMRGISEFPLRFDR